MNFRRVKIEKDDLPTIVVCSTVAETRFDRDVENLRYRARRLEKIVAVLRVENGKRTAGSVGQGGNSAHAPGAIFRSKSRRSSMPDKYV